VKINFVHAQRDLNKITTQWCRTCKTDKKISEFYESHRTKCIECKREEKRLKLRNTVKDFCHSCDTWKPETSFGINSRGDERLKTCNSCAKEKRERLPAVTKQVEIKPKPIAPKENRWHLHQGTVTLFIVGPGEFAMHKCSEPAYRGRIGTPEEREIAKTAVAMLNADIQNNLDAGPEVIQEALIKAKAQHQTT
jgi:hypothetical protein